MPADHISPADVTIRPLRPEDAGAAWSAADAALHELYPKERTADEQAIRLAAGTAALAHLQRTDPSGCWAAELDGEIVGTAIALLREGIWGYSLFGVRPGYQGMGIGGRLYTRALQYGADARGGIILSSRHPAAIRGYARTPGFRLIPTVGLSGDWDPRRAPARLRCRPGDLSADAQTIAAASRHVRGASHLDDLPTLLDLPGSSLLVIEGEGFACRLGDRVVLLAARTQEAASDLLWGAIAGGAPGGRIAFEFVTADNQWAIQVGLEAGLVVAPFEPMFVRGQLGPMTPYLPNGTYL